MTADELNSELKSQTTLQKFYAGQNVLITGGTGFLGKIIIEKLLRSCPHLSAIYLIIRSKKGQDAHQRMDNIFDDPVFDRLKAEVPKFRHKLVAIPGDCTLPGLGISTADQELIMREISIVFYMAATVRFDEKIKEAVITNIIGPMEIMNLCRKIKNLKAFMYTSTAYSNCINSEIDEKFYEPPISADNIVKLIKSLDDDKLEAITPMLIGKFPNTYTYTKCIAEQVIQKYGKDLPTGIFRPAIISSSYEEPISGWVGNYYGPTGILAAAGTGLLKVQIMDKDNMAQLIPADYTANAVIASVWDVANIKNEDADPIIYNYSNSPKSKLTWADYMTISLNHGKQVPCINSIWCYYVIITKYLYLYYILAFFLHLIPGLIVDAVLFVTGKEPRMIKMYKKIHKFSMATAYFTLRSWTFQCNNINRLWVKLSSEDKNIFFFSMDNFDWNSYLQKSILGLRLYILKNDPSNVPAARKRMARILLLHKLCVYSFVLFSAWILYSIISFTLSNTRSELATVSDDMAIR
ncbi:PREDICTED: putative fatty acyl-CoA reductase CG5065 [Ceratosolen solmsi marchali]|uniref:Fatty acyl-CoA reductase n=1 Tax=Ceratosolen solmsi marchali TaxID=326594 RepID=A0AAJ6YKA1_9HYME|nr:PREDICTED: putative fatty acyl-CoA reductase CG5065 [Ceratosolen solmsi marchali]